MLAKGISLKLGSYCVHVQPVRELTAGRGDTQHVSTRTHVPGQV